VNKVVATAAEAVADIGSGASIAVGGFGLSGIPWVLIDGVLAQGAAGLTIVSNNCGVDGAGLGLLLAQRRIDRVIASYIGENAEFARQYLGGDLHVELVPQGTLAERLRAGGAGIPAFYTPAGVGTVIADGGLPWRYDGAGGVAVVSPPGEVRTFALHGRSREYVLEHGITTDFALVRAAVADTHGNAVFRLAARNFNIPAAMAAAVTMLEAERVVPAGDIDPDDVHLPGIFVQRVVPLTRAQATDKRLQTPFGEAG
jgi:3-oxoacid CoA-transferase subunit A